MKKLGLALVLVVLWAVSASAAWVYLKDGSWINARKVWREKGKVVVLVNRDSITAFANSEVNLKKTFPHRKKRFKPVASAGVAPAVARPSHKDGAIAPPDMSTRLPEREPPKADDEGVIRRQQREMEQRLNE